MKTAKRSTPSPAIPNIPSFASSRSTSTLGHLLLSFTETVNATSLNLVRLVVQSDASTAPTSEFTLTGGMHSNVYTPTINVSLSDFDLNSIKFRSGLATSLQDSYLALDPSTIVDMAGNGVTDIPKAQAQRASAFTPDKTPIRLVAFDLDLDTAQIHVNFSETPNRTSLDVTQLWLQHVAMNSSEQRQLVGFSALTWTLTTLTINLTVADTNAVKLNRQLATDAASTFLRFTSSFASDMNGNAISTLPAGEGVQVNAFTADTTPPQLDSFRLDMDSPELLRLTFNEPVDAATLNVSSLTLQGASNITLRQWLSLNDSTVDIIDDTSLTVRLSFKDSSVLKSLPQVASVFGNTFLSITHGGVHDMNANLVVMVSSGAAMATSEFIADTTDPVLSDYTLDMDNSRLTLTFSETVNVTSFVTTNRLTLLGSPGITSGRDDALALSSGTARPRFWYIVEFDLTKTDFDILKSKARTGAGGFATSENNTFLSFSDSTTIYDMFNNPIVAIQPASAKQATTFVADTTLPEVLSVKFTLAKDPILTVHFSEAIDKVTLREAGIEFRDAALAATSQTSPQPDQCDISHCQLDHSPSEPERD